MSKWRNNVLQFICPTGFDGAEKWILALASSLDSEKIQCDLVVTRAENTTDLGLTAYYRNECSAIGKKFEIPMSSQLDTSVLKQLARLVKDRRIDFIHTHGYKSYIQCLN